jgi:hypothetical protein
MPDRVSGKLRVAATLAALVALTASFVIAFGFAQPAHADVGDLVECTEPVVTNPHCDVTAENETEYTQDGDSGEVVCRQDGEVVPCVTEDGWLGSDGCRYLRLDDVSPPAGAEGPGASYQPTCPDDPPGAQRAVVWLPDSQAPVLTMLVEVAVSRLAPPAPRIELSPPPPAPQLVRLPMWLWVDEATWGQRQATASVPGLSVTATATPTVVLWSTGDGGSRTCQGPGTAWRPGMDPAAPSPTCGYTYTASSRDAPGGAYPLSATVTWEISWAGGGASGTVAPLTTSSSTQVVVAESHARNTGGLP